jgi:hypothetical protein
VNWELDLVPSISPELAASFNNLKVSSLHQSERAVDNRLFSYRQFAYVNTQDGKVLISHITESLESSSHMRNPVRAFF